MKICTHEDLIAFKKSFKLALIIFELSKDFPKEERYSLIDQIRRSSRSVSANIAEAYRKRQYPKSFISKIIDAEAEAAETQVWIKFSCEFEYIDTKAAAPLISEYDEIIRILVSMRVNVSKWTFT